MLRITNDSYVRLEQVRSIDITENANSLTEYPHDIAINFVGGGNDTWCVDQDSLNDVRKQLQALTVFPTVSMGEDYEVPDWI